MDVEIRPMARGDVAMVHAIECICFRSPWSKTALLGELKNDVARYLVIDDHETLIGYAGMWVLFEESHITNVAVLPQYRRNGLGRRLMLAMMAVALRAGAMAMTLEVRESNFEAQRLYERLDFHQSGYRPRYYSDSGEGALLMWNMDIAQTLKNNGR